MKENSLRKKIQDSPSRAVILSSARVVGLGAGAAILAGLLGKTQLSEGFFPFGLALIIGINDKYSVFALGGFVVSGLLGGMSDQTPYYAAAAVVVAVKWILAGLSKDGRRRDSFLPSLAAGAISLLITRISVALLVGETSLFAIASVISEAALVGAFAYFYRTSYDVLRRKKSQLELGSAEKACIVLSGATVLMSICPITIGALSAGHILGAFCAAAAAYMLVSPFDAAALAAVGGAIMMSEPKFAFAAAGFVVAGGLATLFKTYKKAFLCLIFVVCAALFSIAAPDYLFAVTYLTELFLGTLVFLILPIKNIQEVGFDYMNDSFKSATAAIGTRLEAMSSAMTDINKILGKTVTDNAARVDLDEIFSKGVETVCRTCPLMSYCWIKCYDETTDALQRSRPLLLQKGIITRDDLAPAFRSRCINAIPLCGDITGRYGAYIDRLYRDKHIRIYKSILRKQFGAIGEMLDSARSELKSFCEWDEVRSKRIFDCAVRLDMSPETASCVFDCDRRPTVTIVLKEKPSERMIKRLKAGVTMITGVTMSSPVMRSSQKGTVLNFTQQPSFTFKTAALQHCAKGDVCGDVYSVFNDARGHVHILLADGMGTGEAAARDGAVSCALLKRLMESGFAVLQAAELVNASMALREDSESACTLDALSFDLFTGVVSVLKAGAAPTYLVNASGIKKISGKTLPVGILDDVSCGSKTLSLCDNDIIAMVTDGVEGEGSTFIESLLAAMRDDQPSEICREIMRTAKHQGTVSDDMTVIVARIGTTSSKLE
ncbi:MAG: PP2C family protein-serine/threonine phosphatase [Oscillospiraceae bacterium]